MYGNGGGATRDDGEKTAYRRAEKKYKLYYDQNKKKKQALPVDLSEVINFRSISEIFCQTGETPQGVYAIQNSDLGRPVFSLQNRPGFYFIPEALSVEEQCNWIRESLTIFPQPPNRTNHNAIYGPITNLFESAREKKALVEEDEPNDTTDQANPRWVFREEEDGSDSRKTQPKSVSASVLLRKLRWSTLGLQYDWSKRNYDLSLPHNKIPDSLGRLVKVLASPAMPSEEEFKPEAAIVNYFGSGDTLGGHLDDMEVDWSKPIVSISLGCKAIFLLGGKTRDVEPVPMFLRSGDVLLMAGEARECFHGVPRIFTNEDHAEIESLEKHLSNYDPCFLEYIRNSRININVRQVF